MLKLKIFIVEDKEDTGGVFLYNHAQDGSGSDTWHRSIADAQEQGAYQFGLPPEAWLDAAVVTDPRLLAAIQLRTLPDSN